MSGLSAAYSVPRVMLRRISGYPILLYYYTPLGPGSSQTPSTPTMPALCPTHLMSQSPWRDSHLSPAPLASLQAPHPQWLAVLQIVAIIKEAGFPNNGDCIKIDELQGMRPLDDTR